MKARLTAGGHAAQGLRASRGHWRGYILANVMAGIVTPLRAPRGAWTRRLLPTWRRLWPYLPPVVVAVAAAMAWVDAPMARAVDLLPGGVIDAFNTLTDYGRGVWPLTPLFVLLVATAPACAPRLSWMARGVVTAAAVRIGYMFLAIGLTGLADSIIKRIIGRARPSDLGPLVFDPLAWRPEYASLPSGHATNVFATLVAVGLVLPRLCPALWIYALVIAASRVIVSAHFTSDVLAGAAFGAFGAILVRDWFARRRLGFYVGSDGHVHVMPGPSWRRLGRVGAALLADRRTGAAGSTRAADD